MSLDDLYEAALAEVKANKEKEAKPARKKSEGGRLSKSFLAKHAVPPVTMDEVRERKLFGPVWHASSEKGREQIAKEGFKVIVGTSHTDDTEHGYPYDHYGYDTGYPPPIHHLGFGVYFTTVKAIAKKFNNNSMTGLVTYYLDVPRVTTINFAATGTMMKWWRQQGYDAELALKGIPAWLEATKKLTAALASKWDAVWFKGKGLRKLLDGDQICVYDPSRIHRLDESTATGLSIGAKVRRKADGMTGKILDKRFLEEHFRQYHGGSTHLFKVKWKVGGADWNVREHDIEPIG